MKQTQKSLVTILCCFIIIFSSCFALSNELVSVDFFVMSKCPDVQRFYHNVAGKLIQDVGAIIDLNIYFIASVDPQSKYGFKSLHGDTEVEGDLLEICAQQLYNTNNTFFKLCMCVNDDMRMIPDNVEHCATHYGMDYQKLKDCAFGIQGKELLTQSINVTNSRQVKWSPTMYLDGEMYCMYGGGPCKADVYADFVKDVCQKYKGSDKPAACH